MKQSFLIYLLIISFLVFSCGKREHFKVVKPFISMDVNGKAWIPDSIRPTGMYADNLMLKDTTLQVNIEASMLNTQDGETFYTEGFTIFLAKKQLGKQTITGAPSVEVSYNYRHPTPNSKVYCFFSTFQQFGEFIC